MKTFGLYTITSGLHRETSENVLSEPFIADLQQQMGCKFAYAGDDFSSYGSHDMELIYIRTGGTEWEFKKVYHLLSGDIHLLTSGKSNSLAASVEILSWLNQQGRRGEILHGSAEEIAAMMVHPSEDIAKLPDGVSTCEWQTPKNLHLRLGIIGKPSDWLISSDPDTVALQTKLGIELVNIPIDELITEARKKAYVMPQGITLHTDYDRDALDGALEIYGALRRLIARYDLQGVTVRCFDLLEPLHNTGCLALAMLNAEGIPAACEGDIPALVTMAVAKQLTGVCGFQANPSRINLGNDEIIFAHCTAPLNMLRRYRYDTHFESGIGVAIKGEMEEGKVTIFKLSPDLKRAFVHKAQLLENLNERALCRTQLKLRCEGIADYLLHQPIGNHHIIVPGDWSNEFNHFCND